MMRFLVVSLSAVLMMTLGLWGGSFFLDQKTIQAAPGDGTVDLAVAICADELAGPPLTDLECVGTKFDGSAHTGTAMIVGHIGGTHSNAVEVQIHNPDPLASAVVDMTISADSIEPGCVAHFSHPIVDIHVRGDFDNDAGTADQIRHLSLEDRRAANAVTVAASTTTRVTLSLLVTCDSTPLPSGSAAFRTDLQLVSSIAVQSPLVEDDLSNNIAEGSSITLDNDGDGEPNATDNCVDDANPGQEDADNDNIGDTCDTDDDDDGTADTLENYLGTDPFDACGVNAWPPDTTDDGTVNAADFGILVDSWQKSSGEQGYIQRADLNGNGTVNAGDFGPIVETWQRSCT